MLKRFEALDGLRGVLALLIALTHLDMAGHFFDIPWVRTAYLSVDFFFVLSGFVITHASYEQLRTKENLLVFIIRRFGRLWPMHIAVLLLLMANESLKLLVTSNADVGADAGAFAAGTQYGWDSIASHVLFLQGWNVNDLSTWNGPSWSISNEFYVYIIFALLVLTARKAVIPASLAIIGVSLWALFQLQPDINTTYDFGALRCLAGFFMGHLVYKVREWRTELLTYPVATELMAFVLMFGFMYVAGFNALAITAPICFSIIVWIFAYQQGPISKMLCTRPLQFLGMLSYSIYITHWFVLLCIKRLVSLIENMFDVHLRVMQPFKYGVAELYYIGNPWIMDLLGLVYVAGLIAFSYICYRLIEDPARHYFNGLSRRYASKKG
jgi:peptidoglycan/LPS O-acetylase OafA/YrhL